MHDMGLEPMQWHNIYLFSSTSRTTLGPAQPTNKLGPEGSIPGAEAVGAGGLPHTAI
jgi:hypothetical protein